MENRFGVKDFVLFVMLGIVIVLVLLAMKQFDRQYQEVQDVKRDTKTLARDVVQMHTEAKVLARDVQDIQQRVSKGVVTPGNPSQQTSEPPATRSSAVRSLSVFAPIVDAESRPDFSRGDWLIDNFGTKIGRLTPLIASDLYQQWVEARVMETLVTRDPNTLKWLPLLAESWEIKDYSDKWQEYVKPLRDKGMSPDEISEAVKKDPNAPLAMELVFRLREGVSFSDGSPLTAEDVVFTFNLCMNPEIDAPRVRAYLENLKEIKATGTHEVHVIFREPYYQSFETIGSTSIMSKKFYSRFKPTEINERTGLLIGTGPFRLEDSENWSPGKTVELVRNQRYWGVPPAFEKIIFREIEDETAEQVTFGNGDLDIFACTPEQYEKMLKDQDIQKMSRHYKYPSPLSGYTYIGWNQKRKVGDKFVDTPFADKRVRQAMTMLIDRDRIANELFLGYWVTASGPFDPNGPQAAPGLKPWPYDERKARELLAQAGYTDRNRDGVIDGPDGKPFEFKLSYPSGNATTKRLVLFLKDSFAAAGVRMEVEALEWSVMLKMVKEGVFDACTMGWGGTVESDPYQIFHSSQIKDQGDNRTHYVNRQLDQLVERARQTIDDEKRMKMWHEVHRILHEDQPYTFLFNRPALVFINNRIANVGTTKLGLNYVRLYPNAIPWYVPRPVQRYTR